MHNHIIGFFLCKTTLHAYFFVLQPQRDISENVGAQNPKVANYRFEKKLYKDQIKQSKC